MSNVMQQANSHLFFFRPGEEARMLARCQFGVNANGQCGAFFTYPIKGYPWRRNLTRGFEFILSKDTKVLLFSEVHRLRKDHPNECLANDQLWSDTTEKANGIIRDRSSGVLCYTIGIYSADGKRKEYFAMREDSVALLSSELFKVITSLLAPHEGL